MLAGSFLPYNVCNLLLWPSLDMWVYALCSINSVFNVVFFFFLNVLTFIKNS